MSWVGFRWDWLWARLALSWVKWIGLHGAGLALGLGQISFGPGVGFGSVWYCAGFALDLVGFELVWFGAGLALGQGFGPGGLVGRWAGLTRMGLVLGWFALVWVCFGLG